jgi:hypothetical protein
MLSCRPRRKSWHADARALELVSGVAHVGPTAAQVMPPVSVQIDTGTMSWIVRGIPIGLGLFAKTAVKSSDAGLMKANFQRAVLGTLSDSFWSPTVSRSECPLLKGGCAGEEFVCTWTYMYLWVLSQTKSAQRKLDPNDFG